MKMNITKEKIPNKKSDFFLFNKKLDVYANGKNKHVLFERYAAIVDRYESFSLFLFDDINANNRKNPINRSALWASQTYGITLQGKILQIVNIRNGSLLPNDFLIKKYTKIQFPKCKKIFIK